MTTTAAAITLRPATDADRTTLEHLASLDSTRVPSGDLLVVEREERVVAAVAVQSLAAIADPFERTDDLVSLLRRQAVARRNARPARRHFGLVPRAA